MEHLCGYAQSDLVVPLLTEAAVSGVPVSVPAANAAAAAWCAEVNAAVHSEIAAVPDERLAAECQLLAPLPSLRPEIGAASAKRKVDRLSCVRYGSARYSVPTRLIGASVNIVIVFEMLFQPLRATRSHASTSSSHAQFTRDAGGALPVTVVRSARPKCSSNGW